MKSQTEEDAINELRKIKAAYSATKKKILPFNTKTRGFIGSMKRFFKKAYFALIGKYILTREYEMLETNFVTEAQGKFVTCFLLPFYEPVFNTEWFENNGNCVELTFEGNQYTVPCYYDLVLETIYGDYMKLPPKEKQTTHHTYKAYYK